MNTRIETLKDIIKEHPETAVLLRNKYKVLAGMTQRLYPETKDIPQDHLADILFDAIQADRELRDLTKPYDQEAKRIAEQNYLLSKGYSPNYYQDINMKQ